MAARIVPPRVPHARECKGCHETEHVRVEHRPPAFVFMDAHPPEDCVASEPLGSIELGCCGEYKAKVRNRTSLVRELGILMEQ